MEVEVKSCFAGKLRIISFLANADLRASLKSIAIVLMVRTCTVQIQYIRVGEVREYIKKATL